MASSAIVIIDFSCRDRRIVAEPRKRCSADLKSTLTRRCPQPHGLCNTRNADKRDAAVSVRGNWDSWLWMARSDGHERAGCSYASWNVVAWDLAFVLL